MSYEHKDNNNAGKKNKTSDCFVFVGTNQGAQQINVLGSVLLPGCGNTRLCLGGCMISNTEIKYNTQKGDNVQCGILFTCVLNSKTTIQQQQ